MVQGKYREEKACDKGHTNTSTTVATITSRSGGGGGGSSSSIVIIGYCNNNFKGKY
jgi:hypothetical protein